MSTPDLTLGAYANDLDKHAIELVEADDYEGAKQAIETAMLFEQRQQQLDDREFAVNAADLSHRLDRIRLAVQPVADGAGYLGGISEVARFAKDILAIAGEL